MQGEPNLSASERANSSKEVMGNVCPQPATRENQKGKMKSAVVAAEAKSYEGITKPKSGSSSNDNGNGIAQDKSKSVSKPAIKFWNKRSTLGKVSKGREISILAFEVANTIVKAANFLQSLSGRQLQLLKEVFTSEGVQNLVSTDMQELLTIAAADKREDLEVFLREVIRFGNQCKDPKWHKLSFSKLDLDNSRCKLSGEEAETSLQQLSSLAQQTMELYQELEALDRFEQDYQRKVKEAESYNLPLRGKDLMSLESKLKHQRKFVEGLKKKSLWSMTMEEIMAKLVNIVVFMHQRMIKVFGDNGRTSFSKEYTTNNGDSRRLGKASLALHYADIVQQIDEIATHPASFYPKDRSRLYHALPKAVKTALPSRVQSIDTKDQLPIPHARAELNKILKWLVPLATNTMKANERFGRVGEWAKTSKEASENTSTRNGMIRLQTLYHADKEKTELYILELTFWLHRLVTMVEQRYHASNPVFIRSPIYQRRNFHPKVQPPISPGSSTGTPSSWTELSRQGKDHSEEVFQRRPTYEGTRKRFCEPGCSQWNEPIEFEKH